MRVKPRERPLLIWDGDCGFCRDWIGRWRAVTGNRVEYAPYQQVAADFPEIPIERFRSAVQLIEPDGRHSSGAEAVFRALARAPRQGAWLWTYRRIPLFRATCEAAYRFVAGHRPTFTGLTRWIWGPHVTPPGERLTSWIFLRLLGLVFVGAFLSLWIQVIGLVGDRGIIPARAFLDFVAARIGPERYWELPTLMWLHHGDGMLHTLCAAGTLGGLALAAGLAPGIGLLLAWFCYLSLASVCREFLWFQWDSLLLEAGFLALFLVPWKLRSRPSDAAPRAGIWLLRWLLFRLMISSALVKLASGDATWRSLTALTYHYQTQPLPPWTAWYAKQLPVAFQRLSALVMFVIEGLVPFLIFAPRRVRFMGAWAVIFLQSLIVLTGNYGFFNTLSIALCVMLFDDGFWPWRWGVSARTPAPPRSESPPRRARTVVAVALLALSLAPLVGTWRRSPPWLGPIPAIERALSPLRIVSSYGLFAVMTTQRLEIVIEGSADGATWRPYEFKWKPGDVGRRPEFTTPHMPRLDWQMWFAALGSVRDNPWFIALCQRLLEGSKPVLSLFARNPFEGAPPRYLRASLYEYRFTDAAARRADGAWWRRESAGPYTPVLTMVEGRLSIAPIQGASPPAAGR